MAWGPWQPYVSAAEKRQRREREARALTAGGRTLSPVAITGRSIARTFWGRAWCDNLERYSDYASRLPRGRTYVRNGSVLDLQLAPGAARALVSGSEIYEVEIDVTAVAAAPWRSICADCAGAIDSLVELLEGKLSTSVMERICRPAVGLFPSPAEIRFDCSCPDTASMCKHVAAVLYGIGARLDDEPRLLFTLRQVEAEALIASAGRDLPLAARAPRAGRVLAGADLGALFGLELASIDAIAPARAPAPRGSRRKPAPPPARPPAKAARQKKPAKPPRKTKTARRSR